MHVHNGPVDLNALSVPRAGCHPLAPLDNDLGQKESSSLCCWGKLRKEHHDPHLTPLFRWSSTARLLDSAASVQETARCRHSVSPLFRRDSKSGEQLNDCAALHAPVSLRRWSVGSWLRAFRRPGGSDAKAAACRHPHFRVTELQGEEAPRCPAT